MMIFACGRNHVSLALIEDVSAFCLLVLQVFKQLNLPPETQASLRDENGEIERAKRPWEFIPAGHKIGAPEPLFKELVCV